MSSPIRVAILGVTGSVGQQFISLLDNHPWFKVVVLAASNRSAGKKYAQAIRWVLDVPMPEYAKDMVIVPANTDAVQAKIVFSALHTEIANELEPQFAQAGASIYNAELLVNESLLYVCHPERSEGSLSMQKRLFTPLRVTWSLDTKRIFVI